MDARRIDHVHLRIPEDEIEHAIEFYQGYLGFPLEEFDEYEQDDTPIFHFRLTPDTIIHVRPTDEFVHPERENFDRLAIILDEDIKDVKQELEDDAIVHRRVGEGPPVQTHYSLTDKGAALKPVFDAIDEWNAEWVDETGEEATETPDV